MKLGCFSQLATLAVAVAAGLGFCSFWWALIPAFLSGSFEISNGPSYDLVIRANAEGRLGVFPTMLVLNIAPWIAVAGIAYWITSAFR